MMPFHIKKKNATVIDGTGKTEGHRSDIGIQGDRIKAIGDLSDAKGLTEIDASGYVVCPGFIDVHVHSEIALLGSRDQFAGIQQGVTTQLLAPDGFGWTCLSPEKAKQLWTYTRFSVGQVDPTPDWPTIESYLDQFTGHSPANVYPQVPHCAIRLNALGWEPRIASDDELRTMENLTRDWMEAGAGVLNLGLDYQPSANADFRELVALCRIAASYGGIYAAHQRYHLLGRKAAWEETIALSKEAEIPVHVSHERVDSEVAEILERVDRENIDLTFESYLYPAGMTHMTMMLPMEFQVGSPEEVMNRLSDPDVKSRSIAELGEWLGRGDQIVGYTGSGRFIGLTLSQAAAQENKPLTEFAYDLILEEREHQTFIFPWQVPSEESEVTVNHTATHPRMMIASDGVYNMPHPHPRGFGCFARVLGHFVRDWGFLSLEEAIYKMSGFPAHRFGLKDRGTIAETKAADLVIFDPDRVSAQSTFKDPIQPPIGIDWVIVNGQLAITTGRPTGALPGTVLRNKN